CHQPVDLIENLSIRLRDLADRFGLDAGEAAVEIGGERVRLSTLGNDAEHGKVDPSGHAKQALRQWQVYEHLLILGVAGIDDALDGNPHLHRPVAVDDVHRLTDLQFHRLRQPPADHGVAVVEPYRHPVALHLPVGGNAPQASEV